MVLLFQVAKTRISVKQIDAYTLTLKNAFQVLIPKCNFCEHFSHAAIRISDADTHEFITMYVRKQ